MTRVDFAEVDGIVSIVLGQDPDARPTGLDAILRTALDKALEALDGRDEVRAVCLVFEAGWPGMAGPLADYDPDPQAPDLTALCARIEGLSIPVVACVSGRVEGGAFALAQAATWRLARADAVFGWPEAALGLWPGGGALVRLARRLGGARVLDMLGAGASVSAQRALALGLCDDILPDVDPARLSASVEALLAGPHPDPEAALADPNGYLTNLDRAVAPAWPDASDQAAQRAREVVEAALLLPRDEALDLDRTVWEDCAATDLCRALRHAARICDLRWIPPEGPRPGPRRIGLWRQQPDLALHLLEAGHEVIFGLPEAAALRRALARIAEFQQADLGDGRITAARRDRDWERLSAVTDPAQMASAQIVIGKMTEAEMPPVPIRVFERPGHRNLPQGAPVVTRSSGLVELFADGAVPAEDQQEVAALMQQAGERIILGGAGPAGIVARLRLCLIASACRTVMAGASPLELDAAFVAHGFLRPPMRMAQKIGPLVLRDRFKVAGVAPAPLISALDAGAPDLLDLSDDTASDPEGQAEWLADLRTRHGITARKIPPAEIVARSLTEMANSGAWLLQHEQAHRVRDIDLAALIGIGVPRSLGGVLFQADRVGPLEMRKRLRALAEEGAPEPVTLWDVLIRNGQRFRDLEL